MGWLILPTSASSVEVIPMPDLPVPTFAVEKQRRTQRDCKYNAAERRVLEPFKIEFRTQTTVHGRLQVLRAKILLAMFNYWWSIGQKVRTEDESRQWTKVS